MTKNTETCSIGCEIGSLRSKPTVFKCNVSVVQKFPYGIHFILYLTESELIMNVLDLIKER